MVASPEDSKLVAEVEPEPEAIPDRLLLRAVL